MIIYLLVVQYSSQFDW